MKKEKKGEALLVINGIILLLGGFNPFEKY